MGKASLQIAEIMTKRPVVIKPGESVAKAAKRMTKYHISSILVQDKQDLQGIITTDDLTFKVLAKGCNPNDILVDDIMTTKIVTADPTITISDAMEILSEHDVRQLPIIHNKKLVGLVTLKDILRVEPALIELLLQNIEFEEHNRREIIERAAESDGFDEDLLR